VVCNSLILLILVFKFCEFYLPCGMLVEAKRRSRYRGPVEFEDHSTGAKPIPMGRLFVYPVKFEDHFTGAAISKSWFFSLLPGVPKFSQDTSCVLPQEIGGQGDNVTFQHEFYINKKPYANNKRYGKVDGTKPCFGKFAG
jgi:hypothetical protein